MRTTLASRTGLWPINKAKLAATELNKNDDDGWKYVVIDCKNGFGRIDVFDEQDELIISGFIL